MAPVQSLETIMFRTLSTPALAAAACLAFAAPAVAAPVLWGGNGHYYEYVGSGASWTDAQAAAIGASFVLGSTTYSGYLATVTSDAENAFLGGLSSDGWIGASDQQDEGLWRWVGGPEAGQIFYQDGLGTLTYAHWNGGEPNNLGNEDYAQYQSGNWNDLPNGSARGYFVEYQADSAVPEPGTWALMILGFGAAGAALRSRRRAPLPA
jgi:hypothetical protein